MAHCLNFPVSLPWCVLAWPTTVRLDSFLSLSLVVFESVIVDLQIKVGFKQKKAVGNFTLEEVVPVIFHIWLRVFQQLVAYFVGY